ncbi:MAG: ABC transporter ATP-binding protein [Helicobacter sp.]|nr:ABC transporter ATP-binding protein [Helicobacter sp.]
MLQIENLEVFYGLIKALKGVSLHIEEHEIITLIGSNGAGKTSTLKAIIQNVKTKGTIKFFGADITKVPTHKIIRRGIALVPEGRQVFTNLSVEENLRMGAYHNDENFATMKERMYQLFPRLKERYKQMAGTMSGGEQQMLAIARALMSEPKLLMLDEPSLGLAPKVVGELFEIIQNLREKGITIFLVEQNAFGALRIANRAYVLENGTIVLKDKAQNLLDNPEIKKRYLGA